MKFKNSLLTSALALCSVAATPPASSGQDGPAAVGENYRSKHFDDVSAHLDFGGEVFVYMDIDGDVKKLAEAFGELIERFRVAEPGMPPELAALDVPALADALGLSGIGALGFSSYKDGETFRNKYYAHIPEGREGVLKIFGGDAGPFAARKLAPAGTDLVIEQDIDLKSLFELAGSLVKEIGGPRAFVEFQAAVSEPMPGSPLTVSDIFSHLDTKVTIVGELVPDRPIPTPREFPLKLPGVNLLVSLDGVGPLFDKLVEMIPPAERARVLQEGDGFRQLTIPVPPDVAGILRPVIRADKASGRVVAASSPEYLAKCLSGESSVWDDESFQEAVEGLPEEGNALSYVSANLSKTVTDLIESALKESGAPLGAAEVVITNLAALGLSPDHSQAAVLVNLPEGLLVVENATGSVKQGLVGMAFGVLGFLGGMITPAMAFDEPGFSAPPPTFEEPAPAFEN